MRAVPLAVAMLLPQPPTGVAPRITDQQPASLAVAHTIAVGQTVEGRLTRDDVLRRADSTYAQRWTFSGTAGQTVTVDLESDEFDAFVFVSGPGIERRLQDDDSGGNCNARLTATLPQTGEYMIVVNTANRAETGGFSLSVTRGSKPPSLRRCSRTR